LLRFRKWEKLQARTRENFAIEHLEIDAVAWYVPVCHGTEHFSPAA